MIRTVPVDSQRLALLAAGPAEAVVDWIDDPATGRRKPGDQSRDEGSGHLLWRVHVLVPGGEASRPELVAVQVPAPEAPTLTEFSPVAFERLEVRVAVDRSGRLAGYWAAAGVASPHAGHGHHSGRGKGAQQDEQAA